MPAPAPTMVNWQLDVSTGVFFDPATGELGVVTQYLGPGGEEVDDFREATVAVVRRQKAPHFGVWDLTFNYGRLN